PLDLQRPHVVRLDLEPSPLELLDLAGQVISVPQHDQVGLRRRGGGRLRERADGPRERAGPERGSNPMSPPPPRVHGAGVPSRRLSGNCGAVARRRYSGRRAPIFPFAVVIVSSTAFTRSWTRALSLSASGFRLFTAPGLRSWPRYFTWSSSVFMTGS